MDPSQLISTIMLSLGYGAYVPLVLAIVGAFSTIATVYPPNWPGASLVHKGALLFNKAAPAVPAEK